MTLSRRHREPSKGVENGTIRTKLPQFRPVGDAPHHASGRGGNSKTALGFSWSQPKRKKSITALNAMKPNEKDPWLFKNNRKFSC